MKDMMAKVLIISLLLQLIAGDAINVPRTITITGEWAGRVVFAMFSPFLDGDRE